MDIVQNYKKVFDLTFSAIVILATIFALYLLSGVSQIKASLSKDERVECVNLINGLPQPNPIVIKPDGQEEEEELTFYLKNGTYFFRIFKENKIIKETGPIVIEPNHQFMIN